MSTRTEDYQFEQNRTMIINHCLDLPLAFAIWQDMGDSVLVSAKMQFLIKVPALVIPSVDFVRSISGIFGNFLYEAVEKVSLARFSNSKYSINIQTKYNKTYNVTLRYNIRTKIYILTVVDAELFNTGVNNNESIILKEKNAILNEILDNLPVPVWQKNKSSKLLYCNREYAKTQNTTVSDVLKNNKVLFRESKQNERSNNNRQDIVNIQIDGKNKSLQVTELNSKVNNTCIFGFAIESVNTEITKELNKQVALREKQIMQIIEGISDGVALFDIDNKLLFYNEVILQIFKLDARDVDGKTLLEIVDLVISKEIFTNSNKDYRNAILETIKNAKSEKIVKTLQIDNGKTIRVTIKVNDDQTILLILRDITSTLAREREVQSTRIVSQSILNNIREGIVIFGSDNRIKFSNSTTNNILKLQLADNEHIRDCFSNIQSENTELEEENNFVENILGYADRRVANSEIVKCDGKTLECSYFPLPDGLNLLKFCDLSSVKLMEMDLKNASDKLAQITSLKSELITTLSDEYTTPLSTIISLAEVLNNKYFGELSEKQTTYCNSIIKTANYLKDISEAITDIALIQTDQINLTFTETDINEFIKETIDEFFKTGKTKILFTPIKPSLLVYIDTNAIKKAVYYIVLKALDMVKDTDSILIAVHCCENNDAIFEIEITNDNLGLSPEDIEYYNQCLAKDVCIGDLRTIDVGYILANLIIQKHNGKMTVVYDENKGISVKMQLQIRQFLV